MSELQLALLAIGSGVIVVVYLYGWWQQRRYRRKFGAAFKSSHADALYGGETQGAAAIAATEADDVGVAVEASADEVVSPPPTTLLDESCGLLAADCDFIIELHLAEPSPAAVLDGLWQRKFDFGKPVQVCGLTLNGQQWERAIAEGQMLYARFRIALQLVDRGGAVSAAKLADFRDLVQGVAGRIGADVTVPELQAAHHGALDMDAFCAEVDQMVGINLLPPGERLLPGAMVSQVAGLHDLTLESDGAFHLMDARGYTLLTLTNADSRPFQHHTLESTASAGLTLLLDVPRVEHPGAQFDAMVRLARELARELQVNLMDDHRVVLSDEGLALIRAQIAAVEEKMLARGIAPGSAQARRLFA